MADEKTEIRAKEKRKKRVFFIKLLIYILLIIFYEDIRSLGFPFSDNILRATTFLLGSNLLISLGRLIAVRFYLRKKGQDPLQSNFVLGINHIAGILNVVAFVVSMMFLFGIKPSEFFTSITIVAAAIALLSKDYITNMINGLIIMFSDQLSLGDNIKIGEQQGKIKDVTLLNLVLINEDADLVMIPNSLILTSQILNHSKQNIRKLTFEFEMKISQNLVVNEIESRLKEAALGFGQHVDKNSFNLKTLAIQRDGVKFKCQFLLNTQKKEVEKDIKRVINQVIIEIARNHEQ